VAFSQRKKNVFYTGGDDCAIKIWNLETKSLIQTISTAHEKNISSIATSTFSKYIFSSK
jgi:WD40 repeat protein